MKKIFTYLLAVAYLIFSTGFSVNTHFCMGETDSITIGGAASDVCGNCGMHTTESKGCCSDELAIYKITDDQHQQSHEIQDFSIDIINLPVAYYFEHNTLNSIAQQKSPKPIHGPPLIIDRCVIFQTFLI